ncbi:MAG: response regulator [Desulfobacca sp. 4484_104]|nr:MAG: response regulator [Desulfobacca sp. 4484_104]RLA87886.1 MAG: sigma-54-dependent Fis family transcriptional regulator [Deltaproteobacteria bacterium]
MSAKILIIDDEPDMLIMLEMIITDKTPHQVVTTTNPLELPELLAQENFNLVITDLKMPAMDGIEVIDTVKNHDPEIPVVVITAFGTLESAEEAVHRGAYDFITKPFRKEQILVAIERALEWQRITRENRELRDRMQSEKTAAKTFRSPGD